MRLLKCSICGFEVTIDTTGKEIAFEFAADVWHSCCLDPSRGDPALCPGLEEQVLSVLRELGSKP
jgi:hypothetical protein